VFMVFAGLFILNMSFVTPAYDCQRTYVPFTELVRDEIQKGRRIGLASDEERDCGQFMFYLNKRMDIVSITNNLVDFLYIGKQPVGVIVPTKHLTKTVQHLSVHRQCLWDSPTYPKHLVQRCRRVACGTQTSGIGLPEHPFRIVKSGHTGYKCNEFVLILNDYPQAPGPGAGSFTN